MILYVKQPHQLLFVDSKANGAPSAARLLYCTQKYIVCFNFLHI